MISVLHISRAKNWRGGENQIAQLMLGLINSDKKIHQHLICVKNSPLHKFSEENKLNYTPISGGVINQLAWVYQVRKQCKINNINIIHLHDSSSQTLAFLTRFFTFLYTPIVLSRKVIFPIKKKLFTQLKYNCLKKIICVSKAVKKVVSERFPEKEVVVIMDCIDTSLIFNKFFFRKKFNFEKQDIIVAYVAALSDEKDHITFLKTAKLIHKEKKNTRFLIVGDGKNRLNLETKSKEMGLEQFVFFTGFLKDANKYFSGVDICLFTSKQEGLGSTVLEFFLSKTPVIATNAGGLKDIVKDYKTGLICDVEDELCLSEKVLKVINDKDLQNKLITCAYKYVIIEHSINKFVENHIQVYESILK